ncbi:MAG: hypothetical protein IPM38_17125 [Ignavibacteria bacterium]|nr:hypothetical protein [Ignavibacteria bacterium]
MKSNQLSEEIISKIEGLFSEKLIKSENSYTLNISHKNINSNICLDIYPEDGNLYLVSVYTNNTHLQLQSCSNMIISDMLEEIIFISESDDQISGLIISKSGDCSLYSNIDRKTLKTDFSELNSEKLLAAIALSVSETLI